MTQYITIKQSTNPQKVITVVSNSQQFNLSIKQAEPEIISELYPFLLVPVTPVKGIDYFDGYTPIKGIDYFDGSQGESFKYSDFTPEQLLLLKGEKGETPVKGIDYFDGQKGDPFTYSDFTSEQLAQLKGNPGIAGYTPLKGIDYFDGIGVPAGGALGQILSKNSPADFDTKWETFTADSIAETSNRIWFTTLLKNKLEGIESGANNYQHPLKHIPEDIDTNSSSRFVSESEKATWNSKANALGVDDFYCTGAEKTKLSNLSGINTGDQDLTAFALKITTINSKPLSNNIILSKSDIGLSNVDNTADSEKPISTAVFTALLNKADSNHSHLKSNISDFPTIPSKTSELTNDLGFITSSYSDPNKQATLVSGTNIKTVNGISLLGSGDITISGESGSEEEIVVLKTTPTSNSSTSLADCGGLFFTADAGKTYLIEVFLLWDTTATTVGIKASLSASTTVNTISGHFITDATAGTPDSSSFNNSDVVTATSASPFTTNNFGCIRAILINSSSSNTIKVRFAAETTGTITIKSGSSLRYRKLN